MDIPLFSNFMNELINPSFTGAAYDPRKSVAVRDRWQQYLYIKNGAKLLDIYVSPDENLVMIFDKKDTKELYEKYRRYELK